MRFKIYQFHLVFILLISLSSCEDVVEVDLETSDSQLVVNAPLQWQKGTKGNYQYIELTSTADFYEDTPTEVTGATVRVLDSEGTAFSFEETDTPGRYECFDFVPRLDQVYELEITHRGETFVATEKLFSVPDLEYTEQVDYDGLGDETEVRAFFTDPLAQENFYLVEDINNRQTVPGYFTLDDQFFDGNQYFSSHFGEDLEPSDEVRFRMYGISSRHHDYLVKLINSYMGGPFQTVPGYLQGNIENITDPDNDALGYFSLSQTSTITHVIE